MPRGVRNRFAPHPPLNLAQLNRSGRTRRVTCTQGWRRSRQLPGTTGRRTKRPRWVVEEPCSARAANVARLLAVDGHGEEATLESEDDAGNLTDWRSLFCSAPKLVPNAGTFPGVAWRINWFTSAPMTAPTPKTTR